MKHLGQATKNLRRRLKYISKRPKHFVPEPKHVLKRPKHISKRPKTAAGGNPAFYLRRPGFAKGGFPLPVPAFTRQSVYAQIINIFSFRRKLHSIRVFAKQNICKAGFHTSFFLKRQNPFILLLSDYMEFSFTLVFISKIKNKFAFRRQTK